MKKEIKLLLPILLLTMSSCGRAPDMKNANYESSAMEADFKEEYKAEESGITLKDESNASFIKQNNQNLKIIKNAQIRFLVSNVDSVTNQIMLLTKQLGGYVSNMKFKQNGYTIENSMTLSIPSESFEDFVTKGTQFSEHIDYNNITSKDVTAEYVDLNNRVKVKEEVKARYEQILRAKTKTIDDVLRAEKQIQQIQEEIEVAKGRMKYINTKSTLSTIKMSLYETVDFKEKPDAYNKSFGSKSKQGFEAGFIVLQNIILGLIYIWPLIIGFSIVFFVLIRRLKKHKPITK